MTNTDQAPIAIPLELVEAIETFPASREVHHCGETFTISPFDIYTDCPQCGKRLKVRALSAALGIEDLFDAFFTWMNQPGNEASVSRRRQEIADD